MGHHSRRGHTAQAVLHFNHHGFTAQPGRPESRSDSCGAAAGDENVYLSEHGKIGLRFRVKIHKNASLEIFQRLDALLFSVYNKNAKFTLIFLSHIFDF